MRNQTETNTQHGRYIAIHNSLMRTQKLSLRHSEGQAGLQKYTITCIRTSTQTTKGAIMLISLSEYGKLHNKSGDTLRRLAERGVLQSAQKIGRNWVVDGDEVYPVRARTAKKPLQLPAKVLSLFSGCGGLDLGFIGGFDFLGKHYSKTGFEIIWANEIDRSACKTYAQNISDHIINANIEDVLTDLPKSADIVIGGFPCQDISINGKMRGIKGKRSSLYSYIVKAVEKTTPKAFVAENVGGLLLKQHEYSLNTILKDFESLGYNISYQLYTATDYGVPQTRKRIFFVGTQKHLSHFIPPQPTHKIPITAKEAIGDLELLDKDKEFSHIWSLANVSGEQGNRRLIADRPGYTIRAECHGNIQFHYSLPRRISMREAARLQSFPDSFIFPCGLRETERQIGNAVPPVLAWNIAQSLKKVIKENMSDAD